MTKTIPLKNHLLSQHWISKCFSHSPLSGPNKLSISFFLSMVISCSTYAEFPMLSILERKICSGGSSKILSNQVLIEFVFHRIVLVCQLILSSVALGFFHGKFKKRTKKQGPKGITWESTRETKGKPQKRSKNNQLPHLTMASLAYTQQYIGHNFNTKTKIQQIKPATGNPIKEQTNHLGTPNDTCSYS